MVNISAAIWNRLAIRPNDLHTLVPTTVQRYLYAGGGFNFEKITGTIRYLLKFFTQSLFYLSFILTLCTIHRHNEGVDSVHRLGFSYYEHTPVRCGNYEKFATRSAALQHHLLTDSSHDDF